MTEKYQIDLTNNHPPNIRLNANEVTLEFAYPESDAESLSNHPQDQHIYQIVMSPELAKRIGELLVNTVVEWEETPASPLPSDHHVWNEIDDLLTKIWSENGQIDSAVDDEWLNETRSSWNNRLKDMEDESDTGE